MSVRWIIFMHLMCVAMALRLSHPFSSARIHSNVISNSVDAQVQTTTGGLLIKTAYRNDKIIGRKMMSSIKCVDLHSNGGQFKINKFGRSFGGRNFHILKKLAMHLSAAKRATRKIARSVKNLIVSLLVFFGQMNTFNVVPRSLGMPVAAMMMGPENAFALSFMKYSQLKSTQKLSTTPVFYLSNSGGYPYLQEDVQSGNIGQKIVVYFMSSEDASEYLNEMAQGNPQNVNEFRIMTTSLEKVLNKIQSKKQSRKLGRYSMNTSYRIQPSTRQCETADRLLGRGKTKKENKKSSSNIKTPIEKEPEFEHLKDISIPMFTAKGLVLERSSGELITPYYFAYEDLREDWIRMTKESAGKSKLPESPSVIVKEFADVMCLSEGMVNPRATTASKRSDASSPSSPTRTKGDRPKVVESIEILSNPGFIPPKREIDMIRRFYRNKSGYKDEYASSILY